MLGEEIKVPANEIDELDGKQADDSCQQNRAAPFRTIRPELAVNGEIHGQNRQKEKRDDSHQLFGCGGSASPVPAQTIPPEGRRHLPTEASRRVQQTPAAQGHKSPLAGVALEGLCQTIWLQDAAVATRTRVALIQHNDLLVKGELLIGWVEHLR